MESYFDNPQKVICEIAKEYDVDIEGIRLEEREGEAADRFHVQLCNGKRFKVCRTPLLKIEAEAKIRKLE